MTVQTTKKQYQITQWTQMIQEYRKSGLTVSSWCREQGLRPQTYYYRLRKVREAACQTIAQEQDTTFVPVTFSSSEKCNSTATSAHIQAGNISISMIHPNWKVFLLKREKSSVCYRKNLYWMLFGRGSIPKQAIHCQNQRLEKHSAMLPTRRKD